MTAWRFEYRAFMDNEPVAVVASIDAAMAAENLSRKTQVASDLYCVGGATDIAVRVRGTEVKMKGPEKAVDDLVDQMYDQRASLPCDASVIANALGLPKDKDARTLKTENEVRLYMKEKGSKTSVVEKQMTKWEGSRYEIEVSAVVIDAAKAWTICVASQDAATVRDVLQKYSIVGVGDKMHYAEAVKQRGQ